MAESDESPGRPVRHHRRQGLAGQITIMVVAIFVLASVLVALRTQMMPEWTGAQPTPGESSAGAPGRDDCPAGKPCPVDNQAPDEVSLSAAETRLMDLVNARRTRSGCPALRMSDQLMTSARGHAVDMVVRGFAGQVNPDHDGPEARAKRAGYQGQVVEIIAAGLPTADEVLAQWTNPNNDAAAPLTAKLTDCQRVAAGVSYQSGQIKTSYGPGVWVLDLGDK